MKTTTFKSKEHFAATMRANEECGMIYSKTVLETYTQSGSVKWPEST